MGTGTGRSAVGRRFNRGQLYHSRKGLMTALWGARGGGNWRDVDIGGGSGGFGSSGNIVGIGPAPPAGSAELSTPSCAVERLCRRLQYRLEAAEAGAAAAPNLSPGGGLRGEILESLEGSSALAVVTVGAAKRFLATTS